MFQRAVLSLLVLCLSIESLVGKLLYKVVMLKENSTAYVVVNNLAKQLPDSESVVTLGFQLDSLESITLPELQKYTIGLPAPSLKFMDRSADDLTRIELMKSFVLNGRLLHSAEAVGEYINPCITKWQGRLLLATGLSWGQAGTKHKPATNTIEFRWVNNTAYPFTTEDPYLGIHNEIEPLPSMIIGQDPRIVVLEDPDRFHIYFTNQFEKIARMGMAEVAVNRTTGIAEVAKSCFTIHPMHEPHNPQKNWSPFLHGKEVLLIQSINPFIVMKVSTQDDKMIAYKESGSESIPLQWSYGDLRGGTNAVYLPDKKVYFAFFHSAGHVPGNFMKTYVMGAYTFSPNPPFRLLSMSPFPIMPEQFYNGPWYPIKQRGIDYCLFPLSIFIEGGETIVMSAGHQDNVGYILKFGLQEVLDTLVSVE
jgi:predicted GH43/DUF377 family glycosyl hydrolase